jgi:hypothetical protein
MRYNLSTQARDAAAGILIWLPSMSSLKEWGGVNARG